MTHPLKQHQQQRAGPRPIQKQPQAPEPEQALQRAPLSRALADLPADPAARSLRRSAMLQMQQDRGNAFVQRQILDAGAPAAEEPATTPSAEPTTAPSAEPAAAPGAAPTEMSAGSSSVQVGPGGVDISGGMVNVSAGMTRVSGVLNADTLIANSVIGASYSPGAGNLM